MCINVGTLWLQVKGEIKPKNPVPLPVLDKKENQTWSGTSR